MELPFKLPDFISERSVLLHHLHDVRLQREHLLLRVRDCQLSELE
jgi:hypothetical protein